MNFFRLAVAVAITFVCSFSSAFALDCPDGYAPVDGFPTSYAANGSSSTACNQAKPAADAAYDTRCKALSENNIVVTGTWGPCFGVVNPVTGTVDYYSASISALCCTIAAY